MPNQLGLERTPQEYVKKLLAGFREIRRVLRSDGTLWLNLGDSYNSAGRTDHGNRTGYIQSTNRATNAGADWNRPTDPNLKPKDLVGIPWTVAFALRSEGWYLRSDIIWHKPNPMPESVLDRPTKSHEYLFLLTKSESYYYDFEAIRQQQADASEEKAKYGWSGVTNDGSNRGNSESTFQRMAQTGVPIATIPHDARQGTVWTIPSHPFSEAHLANFPPALVEACILAGTSEKGCCSLCGAPWQRVLEHIPSVTNRSTGHELMGESRQYPASDTFVEPAYNRTIGWEATCSCDRDPTPATVLDPFCGAGTCGLVAARFHRNFIGVELNAVYAKMAQERITRDAPLFNRLQIG